MSELDTNPKIDRKGTLFGVLTKAMKAQQRIKMGLDQHETAAPASSQGKQGGSEREFGTVMPDGHSPREHHLAATAGGGGGGGAGGSPRSDGSLSPSSQGSSGQRTPRQGGNKEYHIEDELSNRPLPLQYVIENLNKRIAVRHLYTDLLLYVPFLVLFFVFYLYGRQIESNHYTVSATRNAYLNHQFPLPAENVARCLATPVDPNVYIGECILDQDRHFATVRGSKDYLQWLNSVLVPNTWDCENPDHSHNPLARRGQQTNLGAMQIRIINSMNTSCTYNPEMTQTVDTLGKAQCYSSYGYGVTDTTSYCGVLNPSIPSETLFTYHVGAGTLTTGTNSVYNSGGYVMTLPFNATCNQIRATIAILSQGNAGDPCRIIDDSRTRLVMAEWFVYNPNTDTFSTAKMFYEGMAGGAWLRNYQFRPFPVWSVNRLSETAFTIFFLVFLLYFWYRFFYEGVQHYRRYSELSSYLFNVWNVLELTNLTTFFAVIILRLMWWSKSTQQSSTQPFAPIYPQTLDAVALLFSAQIYANAVNAVITVLKTLKFVRLNNRLNILTRTLDAAKESIAGVMLLFIFVLLGYAVSGTALYGGNMRMFQNLNTSFSSLLFFLFGGFDYDKMRSLQPLLTGVYFFTYIILSNFLLLNFIIAILGEGFTSVSHSSSLEPLDKLFLRWLNMLRYKLHPKYLRKFVELSLRGKSRADLLFEMTKYLQEHMDLIELTSPELLDSDLPITKQDLKNWLPEHLDEDLGDFYIAILWDDLDHEHSIDILSHEYLLKKEIEELVSIGVGQSVARTLVDFDGIAQVIERLEGRIALLEDAVKL